MNLIIRQASEGNNITMIVEYNNIKGLVPNDFIGFINNWAGFTKWFNPFCRSIESMKETGNLYETYKAVTKAPWPMDDRVLFTAVYKLCDLAEDEHMLICSDKGLDHVFNLNMTPKE